MAALASEAPYVHPEPESPELPPQVSSEGYGLGHEPHQHADQSALLPPSDIDMIDAPPTDQTKLDSEEAPYRLSVEDVAPQRALSNSKSYASRANARPDLSLDTDSPTATYSKRDTATSATRVSRGGSVSERSPLQKLEMTLGDISKEEKRARVAEAERAAPTTRKAPNESTSRQVSQRRTQNEPTASTSRGFDTSTMTQHESEMLSFPTRTFRYDAPHPMHIPQRHGLGYDSSQTGAAAAAAIGAYRAHNRQRSSTTDSVSRDLPPVGHEEPTRAEHPGVEERDLQPTQTRRVGFLDDQETSQTNNESGGISTGAMVGTGAAVGAVAALGTAAAVGASHSEEAPHGEEETAESHSRFSHLFHRGQYQTRRYQAMKHTEDWKGAQTAVLTGADLDRENGGEAETAWWERDGESSKDKGTAARALDPDTQDAAYDHQAQQTTFQPKLFLRCGPLLRYTGVRKELSTDTEYWRGTVMIVTEDHDSSYEVVPTLRIFQQNQPEEMTVLETNGTARDKPPADRFDPIAGHHTISRTGATLYVRSVHDLPKLTDLSRNETNDGLYEQRHSDDSKGTVKGSGGDGEGTSHFREVRAIKLHAERGMTFWRFHVEVEKTDQQSRVAYRINRGPTSSFWVPAKGQNMNIMFHSCNGFSLTVDTSNFCGPDPLWRDVLNNHHNAPFHCMIGGGDQIYNDAAMRETHFFQQWLAVKNPEHKHNAAFSAEMQEELESFYLNRYAMWFSQGLFAMAASQIPMVNVWDDHDIIDGFGSYPDHFMRTPVFSGVGEVAFKYYLLFQHHSIVDETSETEPSWILGAHPGPYIQQLSRSLFVPLGNSVAFLGLDCRTERRRDEILTQESWDIVFDRTRREIASGQVKHLLVLLGVPIAYPRMNFVENILTSRMMDPIKALGRRGAFGGIMNKFDGGVEVLDDLDDHWTAKHHKAERNWFIQELQDLAYDTHVRITILGGDVHLAAIGQFYTNKKEGIPKDQDHRYMPNIISSAIVNTPPPEVVADALNKRNKVHHLDQDTDEDMVPLFTRDVDGKSRNNMRLLPRRNWCSIRAYEPGQTPPPTPPPEEAPKRSRSFSLSRNSSMSRSGSEKRSLLRRFSTRKAPPSSYQAPDDFGQDGTSQSLNSGNEGSRQRPSTSDGPNASSEFSEENRGRPSFARSSSLRRLSASLTRRNSVKANAIQDVPNVNFMGGLDIVFHCESYPGDPAGITTPYRFLVPALLTSGLHNDGHVPGQNIGEAAGSRDIAGVRDPNDNQNLTGNRNLDSNSAGIAAAAGLGAIGVGGVAAAAASGHEGKAEENHGEFAAQQTSASRDINPAGVSTTAREDPPSSPQQSYKSALDRDVEDENHHPQTQSGTMFQYSPESFHPEKHDQGATHVPGSSTAMESDAARAMDTQEQTTRDSGRWTLERRTSATGPRPPSNVDKLPASVQKRYSQFVQTEDDYEHAAPARSSALPMSSSARNSMYTTPMTTPLLPTNVNQLRSSEKRTNQMEYDEDNGNRSVSGGATNSAAYDSGYAAGQNIYDAPQRAATYHGRSASKAKTSTSAPFRSPLTSAPSNGFVSPPPEHRDQIQIPQKAPRDPYAFYDDEESPPQQPTARRPSKFERHYGGFSGTYDPMASKPTQPFATSYNKDKGPLLPAPKPMVINPEPEQPPPQPKFQQTGYGQTAALPLANSYSATRTGAGAHGSQYADQYYDDESYDEYDDEPRGGRISGLFRRLTDSADRRRLRKPWK